MELPPEIDMSAPIFTLKLTSAEGETVFRVNFSILGDGDAIVLDRSSIVF